MKRHLLIVTLLLTILVSSVFEIQAQVAIGISSAPERGAALEVKDRDITVNPDSWQPADLTNSDKGILFPKVELYAYNSLRPLYYLPDASNEEKLRAKGMVVYNIASIPGVEIGLAQWDGAEWKPLTGSSGGIASIECTTAEEAVLNGYYVKGVSLDRTNTIVLPVTVTKAGSYSARIVVREGSTSAEAPFSFTAVGEFTGTDGIQYITFQGQGAPTKYSIYPTDDTPNPVPDPYTENLGANEIDLYFNGKKVLCTLPTINVDKAKAVFTFKCGTAQFMVGSNEKKSISKAASSALLLRVEINSSTPGATYHIKTDEMNGMKFEASGTLSLGSNTIYLEPVNADPLNPTKMLKSGAYLYTISGNSAGVNTTCTAQIDVLHESVKILLIGYGGGGSASTVGNSWNLNYNYACIRMMLNNPDIFDLGVNHDAPCHISGFAITSLESHGATNAMWSSMSTDVLASFDLIIVSYTAVPSASFAQQLCQVVKRGKTTVLFTVDWESGTGRDRIGEIINTLSEQSTSSLNFTYDGDGDNLFEFIGGNLAVNGRYTAYKNIDLAGKYLGRDGAYNFRVNVSNSKYDDWIVLAKTVGSNTPRTTAKLLMHKKYRMFLSGDGGIFTGGYCGHRSDYCHLEYHGASVDANGNPIPKSYTNGVSYNAHFLANLMIWAFEAAGE